MAVGDKTTRVDQLKNNALTNGVIISAFASGVLSPVSHARLNKFTINEPLKETHSAKAPRKPAKQSQLRKSSTDLLYAEDLVYIIDDLPANREGFAQNEVHISQLSGGDEYESLPAFNGTKDLQYTIEDKDIIVGRGRQIKTTEPHISFLPGLFTPLSGFLLQSDSRHYFDQIEILETNAKKADSRKEFQDKTKFFQEKIDGKNNGSQREI